jgi:hypothetical protein
MESTLTHACAKTTFVTFSNLSNVSPFHLHEFVGVGNFMKDGWSACAPTAYDVVRDCLSLRNFGLDNEIHV